MNAAAVEPVLVAGSTPYPWPYEGMPSPERVALVLVAPQRALAGLPEAETVLERAFALAARVRTVGASVVAVRHGVRGSARPGIPARWAVDWGLLDGVAALADVVVDAAGIDGFYGGDLDDVLRAGDVSHLILAGLGLETFVHSTLRHANDLGYECAVAVDACASVESGLRAASASTIEMSGGIFGAVALTDALISALEASERS